MSLQNNVKMAKILFKVTLLIVFALFVTPNVSMANGLDFLRSTGKIYSVVAVVVVIFIGLAIYLWKIDKKLSKLENHIKDE